MVDTKLMLTAVAYSQGSGIGSYKEYYSLGFSSSNWGLECAW